MKENRNTTAMMNSPRCGANTRKGTPCKSPAVWSKKRCRMHGGACGSGATKDNKNALKHGYYTAKFITERERLNAMLQKFKRTLDDL